MNALYATKWIYGDGEHEYDLKSSAGNSKFSLLMHLKSNNFYYEVKLKVGWENGMEAKLQTGRMHLLEGMYEVYWDCSWTEAISEMACPDYNILGSDKLYPSATTYSL